MATYDEFRAAKRFDGLTGIRTIAVLLVFTVHFGGDQLHFLSGWLGVQVFFVVSGFLITSLLIREEEKNGSVSLGGFYIRRAFRIFPVYYFIFAIVIFQTFELGGESWDQLKRALPFYALFFNEYSGAAPWGQTWTLGIEWKFYLVWPLLVFAMPIKPYARVGIIAVLMLLAAVFWNGPHIMPVHYVVLLMGAAMAVVMHTRAGFSIVSALLHPLPLAILCCVFVGLQCSIAVIPTDDAKKAVIYAALVVLLLPATVCPSFLSRALATRPMVFIGDRSYSMYLVQVIAFQTINGLVPNYPAGITKFIMVAAMGLLFSDALYRWIEQPMIKLGHMLAATKRFKALPDIFPIRRLKVSSPDAVRL